MNDFDVVGHYSNTQTKTLLLCHEKIDNEIYYKDLVIGLNSLYVKHRQNAFERIGEPFFSRNISKDISNMLKKYFQTHIRKP
jgi:hypothetical protein